VLEMVFFDCAAPAAPVAARPSAVPEPDKATATVVAMIFGRETVVSWTSPAALTVELNK